MKRLKTIYERGWPQARIFEMKSDPPHSDQRISSGMGFSTASVHAGETAEKAHRPLTSPIYQTATYTFEDTQNLHDFFQGKLNRVAEYGRYGNPTQNIAENKLKILENAEACLLCASGMTAVTTAILSICRQGDHIVITDDSYRRTRQFVMQVLSKFGIDFSFVEPRMKYIQEAILRKKTKLLISESPTNPYLHVLDMKAIAEICKQNQVKSLIDSTFATPYNQRPLDFGIDIVVHSITKYLGGHNDILGGAIFGKEHLITAFKELLSIMGGVIDPNSCYLLIRGLKTFALRIKHQNDSAQKIAEFLEAHPKIEKVYYLGLSSHPNHDLASKQMRGFGGVISFLVKADLAHTSKFIDRVRLAQIAPSLGGVETLIEQPALMSYYEMPEAERVQIGIYGNLVRLSVGIEDTEDLMDDIDQALAGI